MRLGIILVQRNRSPLDLGSNSGEARPIPGFPNFSAHLRPRSPAFYHAKPLVFDASLLDKLGLNRELLR